MARQTKPVTEYLRVRLTAACLADQFKVARTGYGLARWFEADQNLSKYSIDEKGWRRFIDGHKPHQRRLAKIFDAAPSARALFDHPFWIAINLNCGEGRSIRILDSFGWSPHRKYKLWFASHPELSPFDRLTCLLAMLSCERAQYHRWEIGRRICVEFVDICTSSVWGAFYDDLLLILRIKMEKTVGTLSGLTEMEVPIAQEYWGLVKDDFFKNESIAGERAWYAWREAVYTLNWQDQFRLRDFIRARNTTEESQFEELDQRVYRKVRARMYRALNKSRGLVTLVPL